MPLLIDIYLPVWTKLVSNKFLYQVVFSILTAFPPLTNHAILDDVRTLKLELYAKWLARSAFCDCVFLWSYSLTNFGSFMTTSVP